MPDEKLLLRVGEVGKALGLSRGAVYALILNGSIPSVKIGRSRRVAKSDLEAWVTDQLARESQADRR